MSVDESRHMAVVVGNSVREAFSRDIFGPNLSTVMSDIEANKWSVTATEALSLGQLPTPRGGFGAYSAEEARRVTAKDSKRPREGEPEDGGWQPVQPRFGR